MRRMRYALAIAVLLVAAGAHADGRAYRNDTLKVRFEAPVGWDAVGAGNYPRLLQSYENRDGGRMTLVGQKVAVGTTARALVEESRAALVRQGFRNVVVVADKDDPTRMHLEADIGGGREIVRQLYAVTEGMGFVVTVAGPMLKGPQLKRDFDEAAASLQLGDAPPVQTR
jgi:hypothetical protein